jgi:hypothetical protein
MKNFGFKPLARTRRSQGPRGRHARPHHAAVMESLEGRAMFQGVVSSAVPWARPARARSRHDPHAHAHANADPHADPNAHGPNLSVDKTSVAFNDVLGGSGSRNVSFTIRNSGDQPLTINSIALSGAEASQFKIANKPGDGSTLAPGASAAVSANFTAAGGAGLKAANVAINSNDPDQGTTNVALRGLATTGTGGEQEPSLQRILDAYGLDIRSGDPNPSTTYLLSDSETRGANDEVTVQKLVKAGNGPVTIQPLAVFAGGDPAARFGYYPAGNPGGRTQVFSVPGADAQSVVVNANGSTSFDPGSAPFGLFAHFEFPGVLNNTMYSEDNLNTAENDAASKRKVRFFTTGEPNAYLFTFEDYNNHPENATDANDLVGIIRNVRSTSDAGGNLSVQNLDTLPFNDRLIFNRVKNQPPLPITNPDGSVRQPPNNVVHDTATARITNTSDAPITINDLVVTSAHANAWQVTSGPADGAVLQPGQSADITLKFILNTRPDNGVNETNDPSGGARFRAGSTTGSLTIKTSRGDQAIQLAGWFQSNNESAEEPSIQTMVNKLLGYKTVIANEGQDIDTGGRRQAVGEEVLSSYWKKAGGGNVTVRQLAAWHTQGDANSFGWHTQGSGSQKTLFAHKGDEGQSWLPSKTGGGPGRRQLSTRQQQLRVRRGRLRVERRRAQSGGASTGHHFRFWPARDRGGNLIANTYIVGMDFQGINYDYQDNLYLISNIKPA